MSVPARTRGPAGGFTLVELLIALALLALMSAVLAGSLSLAARSTEAGETKVEENTSMRVTHGFLRAQIEGQHGQRLKKVAEYPLLFRGEREEMRFAAPLPARVQGGGLWYYRLRIAEVDGRPSLLLDRTIPDVNASAPPDFAGAEHSVLATDVKSLAIGYYGRETGLQEGFEPAWRDRWEDLQRLPMMIRIDVEPRRGPKWPTLYAAPREAPEAGCRAWDQARGRCVQG